MTTKELEKHIYTYLWKQGTYMCFEVAIPSVICGKYECRERVDLLSYETKGNYRCYELKVSKSDFNSKAKLSWYGNYNYYVMPIDLYDTVKDSIPKGIGIYVVYDNGACGCKKRASKRDISQEWKDSLLFALMQSLSREYSKLFMKNRHK